jgi:predicted GNAT family acetyltransferase
MTGAVAEFLAEADEFLRADPVRNTVILSVTDALMAAARRPPAAGRQLFGWWHEEPGGPVRAAFIQTPPVPPFLSTRADRAAPELAAAFADMGRQVGGINAEQHVAKVFAAAWQDRTGDTAEPRVRMRLHRLGDLIPPDPAPDGAPRLADWQDRKLLTGWFEAFDRETGNPAGRDHAAVVAERLGHGGLTVWEAAGAPVSLAGVTPVLHRMARVAPVYTPLPRRGHGYAGAVTAAVSQAALDAGATDVVLYTDLANQVSNSVYRRLGYRPVEDRLTLDFRRQALRCTDDRHSKELNPMEPQRRVIVLPDGRDIEMLIAGDDDGLPLVLHEGTPVGLALYPLVVAAALARGLRVILAARPGYEGSTPRPGRRVADVAVDTVAILDALGAGTFVTAGWSGGGPHALACAAELPGRCLAAASIAGVAPTTPKGLTGWPAWARRT